MKRIIQNHIDAINDNAVSESTIKINFVKQTKFGGSYLCLKIKNKCC